MSVETTEKYGYRIEIERTERDGQYHETRTAIARVIDPGTGKVLHTTSPRTDRSGHQLKKNYRHAEDMGPAVLEDAVRWMIDNLPAARAELEEERNRMRAEARERHRARYVELGGDALAYLMEIDHLLTATEMADILNVPVRQLNKLLIGWGLQEKQSDGYWPTSHDHARIVGTFAQLKWTMAGMKAAWDAGMKDGTFTGGDAEFVERIRAFTTWLSFLDEETGETAR